MTQPPIQGEKMVETEARAYFERIRWPSGVACPRCDEGAKVIRLAADGAMGPGWFHCGICRRSFTARTGTLFHRSRVPWHLWLRVIDAFVGEDAPNLLALSRETGLTYKAVRRMADLIRPERPKRSAVPGESGYSPLPLTRAMGR